MTAELWFSQGELDEINAELAPGLTPLAGYSERPVLRLRPSPFDLLVEAAFTADEQRREAASHGSPGSGPSPRPPSGPGDEPIASSPPPPMTAAMLRSRPARRSMVSGEIDVPVDLRTTQPQLPAVNTDESPFNTVEIAYDEPHRPAQAGHAAQPSAGLAALAAAVGLSSSSSFSGGASFSSLSGSGLASGSQPSSGDVLSSSPPPSASNVKVAVADEAGGSVPSNQASAIEALSRAVHESGGTGRTAPEMAALLHDPDITPVPSGTSRDNELTLVESAHTPALPLDDFEVDVVSEEITAPGRKLSQPPPTPREAVDLSPAEPVEEQDQLAEEEDDLAEDSAEDSGEEQGDEDAEEDYAEDDGEGGEDEEDGEEQDGDEDDQDDEFEQGEDAQELVIEAGLPSGMSSEATPPYPGSLAQVASQLAQPAQPLGGQAPAAAAQHDDGGQADRGSPVETSPAQPALTNILTQPLPIVSAATSGEEAAAQTVAHRPTGAAQTGVRPPPVPTGRRTPPLGVPLSSWVASSGPAAAVPEPGPEPGKEAPQEPVAPPRPRVESTDPLFFMTGHTPRRSEAGPGPQREPGPPGPSPTQASHTSLSALREPPSAAASSITPPGPASPGDGSQGATMDRAVVVALHEMDTPPRGTSLRDALPREPPPPPAPPRDVPPPHPSLAPQSPQSPQSAGPPSVKKLIPPTPPAAAVPPTPPVSSLPPKQPTQGSGPTVPKISPSMPPPPIPAVAPPPIPAPPPPVAGRPTPPLHAPATVPAPAPPPPLPGSSDELQKRKRRRGKQWFEEIFDEDYLRTLPYLTPRQTEREVAFILEALELPAGSKVLDVGCGYGRHAMEIASRGHRPVGIDLSLPLLIRAADAARRVGVTVDFVHGDMREMTFDGEFDAAYCFFSTFGYFDDDTNRKVAAGICRALRPGGRFVLDLLNRDYLIGDLPTRIWWQGDGCVVLEEVDFNYFTSRLQVQRQIILEDGRQIEHEISIRAYSLHEIGKVLHHAGFRVLEVSGGLSLRGRFFGADSRQLLVVAEKRTDP